MICMQGRGRGHKFMHTHFKSRFKRLSEWEERGQQKMCFEHALPPYAPALPHLNNGRSLKKYYVTHVNAHMAFL